MEVIKVITSMINSMNFMIIFSLLAAIDPPSHRSIHLENLYKTNFAECFCFMSELVTPMFQRFIWMHSQALCPILKMYFSNIYLEIDVKRMIRNENTMT